MKFTFSSIEAVSDNKVQGLQLKFVIRDKQNWEKAFSLPCYEVKEDFSNMTQEECATWLNNLANQLLEFKPE